MKADIFTVIGAALVGILVAYFVTNNLILKAPTAFSVKTLSSSVSSGLSEPSPEIFNYRALNPTVEVYIDCSNYDMAGNCVESVTPVEEEPEE